MTMITAKGRLLAVKLQRAYENQHAPIVSVCSLISRHAETHARLAVEECNGPHGVEHMDARAIERWQVDLERRQEACERRIKALVAQLPPTQHGPITARLGGDPRGCTVKLAMPEQLASLHDDWGREGVCVETGRN